MTKIITTATGRCVLWAIEVLGLAAVGFALLYVPMKCQVWLLLQTASCAPNACYEQVAADLISLASSTGMTMVAMLLAGLIVAAVADSLRYNGRLK